MHQSSVCCIITNLKPTLYKTIQNLVVFHTTNSNHLSYFCGEKYFSQTGHYVSIFTTFAMSRIMGVMDKYKTKEIIKIIEADGWFFVRQKGSHRQYKHKTKKGTVTINGKLNETQEQELINSIFKQAGLK